MVLKEILASITEIIPQESIVFRGYYFPALKKDEETHKGNKIVMIGIRPVPMVPNSSNTECIFKR
ncbi:hypothetical protein CHS0354_012443, partial [Potamilus streckersoni]